jgi:hypothetical protein
MVCSVPSIRQENPQLVVRRVSKGMLLKTTATLKTPDLVCTFPPKAKLAVNKPSNIARLFVKMAAA